MRDPRKGGDLARAVAALLQSRSIGAGLAGLAAPLVSFPRCSRDRPADLDGWCAGLVLVSSGAAGLVLLVRWAGAAGLVSCSCRLVRWAGLGSWSRARVPMCGRFAPVLPLRLVVSLPCVSAPLSPRCVSVGVGAV